MTIVLYDIRGSRWKYHIKINRYAGIWNFFGRSENDLWWPFGTILQWAWKTRKIDRKLRKSDLEFGKYSEKRLFLNFRDHCFISHFGLKPSSPDSCTWIKVQIHSVNEWCSKINSLSSMWFVVEFVRLVTSIKYYQFILLLHLSVVVEF